MKLQNTVLFCTIVAIVLLALFGSGLKEKASKGLAEEIDGYNCDGGICTTCIIDGESCNCGPEVCTCGSTTVDKEECSLLR